MQPNRPTKFELSVTTNHNVTSLLFSRTVVFERSPGIEVWVAGVVLVCLGPVLCVLRQAELEEIDEVVDTVAKKDICKPAKLEDFDSSTLHISLLRVRIPLLRCTFLSYTSQISLIYTLAKFLFSARISLAEQRNSSHRREIIEGKSTSMRGLSFSATVDSIRRSWPSYQVCGGRGGGTRSIRGTDTPAHR